MADLSRRPAGDGVNGNDRGNGNGNGKGGAPEPELTPPRIDLPLPAGIPPDYIAHLPARLAFYQRLSRLTDRAHIAAVKADLEDRFGPLPEPAENLLAITDLRCLGAAAGAESIAGGRDGIITVVFRSPVGDARQALQNRMGPGVKVGRRDLEIRAVGDADFGVARLGRALRRVAAFVAEMQEAMAAGGAPAKAAAPPTAVAPVKATAPASSSVNGSGGNSSNGNGSGATAARSRSRPRHRRRRQAQGVGGGR